MCVFNVYAEGHRCGNHDVVVVGGDWNDVDEDGKPKTVSAAMRIYHNNSKTRKIYC